MEVTPPPPLHPKSKPLFIGQYCPKREMFASLITRVTVLFLKLALSLIEIDMPSLFTVPPLFSPSFLFFCSNYQYGSCFSWFPSSFSFLLLDFRIINSCYDHFQDLKLTGRDRSWTGDYAACGHCHLAHAAGFAHVPYLLPSHDGSIPCELA